MKHNKHDIERLAVEFWSCHLSPNLRHVGVYNLIESIGGQVAIQYGIYLGTNTRHKWQCQSRAAAVAEALERYAKSL